MPKAANAAFMKELTISPALAKIVGTKPLPRTQVVKKLWDYIKKNKLQDTKNKRNINADENLKAVFGGKSTVSMFEMTKLVSKHLS
ncbi:MAG: SWIB/MDM2 domain-containing protein [Elusimicrobia bacterium]|nr:SWIB/MDM2 domain-containing protein [Elusimicrobiota bacterium]MDE2314116.1 SWIB/MDM2 domain-containing protein [Elusimicrobiota bacterium]